MRPFGCPVTILNTLDPLVKFDGKADEGFLVGYYVNSKAFRVFNSRTKNFQETLHINFLKNQPNIVRSGPKWLFDIYTLTQSMNYSPVVAGNQHNHNACIKENLNADANVSFDAKENENEVHVSLSGSDKTKKHDDKAKSADKGKNPVDLSTGVRDLRDDYEEFFVNSTNRVNATSAPVTATGPNPTNNTNSFNTASPSNTTVSPNFGISRKCLLVDPSNYPDDPNMPALEDIIYSDDEEDVAPQTMSMARMVKEHGGLTQINNEDFHTCMFACFLSQEEPKKLQQALKDPSWIKAMQEELLQFKIQKEEFIDYDEVFPPVARIEAIRLFLAYASFMGFMVYQMDVKSAFLYETNKEEVYVCQPLGCEDPGYPDKVYKVVKALYGLLIAGFQDDILKTEMPPHKSTLDAEARRRGIGEVGYGIRDTWVDPVEAVPEIAPMTIGEQAEIAELRKTNRRRQAQMVKTLRVMGDMRRDMGDMHAKLLPL
nr:hypothetical protein [Tanacetum cinerariifolium]